MLSLFAGILFTLAFAPFNLSYLVFPSLALLFFLCRPLQAKQAFVRGYAFGLGQFGLGVSWVYVSVHDYGGGGLLGSLGIAGLFCGFWAIFPALAMALAVKLPAKCAVRWILFPTLWLLVEYLRGRIVLEGFPWLQISYSQLDTPLAGYIPVLGGYGTGLIAALIAVMLVKIADKPKRSLCWIGMSAVIFGFGAFLKTLSWTQPMGAPIQATLIQGNIAQDKKWLPETRIGTIVQYIRMTQAHWDSQLVIWPESAVPAYLSDVKQGFIDPLNQEARAHQTDLIVSVPSYGQSEGEKYNSLITLGRTEGMYRKIHLLPFGEYMPWQPVSGWILAHFNLRLSSFTPGAVDQPLLEAAGYRFSTTICYEDAFADNALRDLPEAAYLVNATNDAWFGDSIEPHQHLQIARMRALESGRYLLRATNTGVTAIISPQGKITAQAPLFATTALTGTFEPMGGMTPYAKLGDRPAIYLALTLLIVILSQSRAKRVKAI